MQANYSATFAPFGKDAEILGGTVEHSLDTLAEMLVDVAIANGFFPALGQRALEIANVLDWAHRVCQPGFVWADANDVTVQAILVGEGPDGTTAIFAGQHRILGGLLGGNPVPESSLNRMRVSDRTQPWLDAPMLFTSDLLALLV